jgi:uncharacterized protein
VDPDVGSEERAPRQVDVTAAALGSVEMETEPVNRAAALLSRLVTRAPLLVVLGAVVLTGVLGAVSTQAEFATGNEGFAPENEELLAAETIAERFDGSNDAVVQVLVRGEDVISADGLAAVDTVLEAIAASDAGPYLSERPERPAVVHWLLPVQQALAEQGIDPATLDDDAVDAAFADALATMPDDQAGMITSLLPDDASLDGAPAADTGLAVVFLDADAIAPPDATDTERFDAMAAVDRSIADAVADAEFIEGYSADAFSFMLLFDDQDAFQRELGRLFGSAFLIILVILGFVYWVKPGAGSRVIPGIRRTVADVLLTMATIVMAIVWMNGIGVLLGPGYLGWIGAMNDVSQIVPVLLIGLGVDYAIHLTTRYREEVAAGGSVADAIRRAITTVGVALTLATVTTAVGFLTNIINPMPALRDFGVLAAVGIVSSFLLMLTFVPSVRLLLDRRAERAGVLPRQALGRTSERFLPELMARVAVLAERVPIPTLVVTILLGGALGVWGLSQLEVRFSFTDFVSEDAPAVVTFDEIVDRFDGGFGETTDVLVEGEVATPEAHNALVDATGALAEVPDVSTYGEVAQAESPVGLLGLLLAPGPDGTPAVPEVAEAAAAAGVGEDLTVAADADVAALYDTLVAAAPEQAERVLARDDAGTFDAARVAIQTNAGEAGAGELRTALIDAFAPVAATGAEVTPTSQEIISDVIVNALSESQVSSMIITLVVAMLLLVVTYWFRSRRPALGVITVLPVALVVLWTFAMMAATGIPFGPITATIAALAIGIGVPYTIHITNRYQEDRLLHADPADAIRSTVRHTGGALAGSAFTTCAGFGILITSTLTPFRQFGFVTVYAIGFALLASTLVLPSMLELWDRWHRRQGPPIEPQHEARTPVGA